MKYLRARGVSWSLLALSVVLLWPQAGLAAGKVLRVRFDGKMLEKPDENAQFFALLGGGQARSLRGYVKMLDKAAADPDIRGIAMIIEQPQMGFAQLEEITQALHAFRKSGKKIYCYMDYASNGTYALACAADSITLAENSELGIVGLHAELSYYKNLLDKIGVQAQLMHCGAYKSALEPFTRTGPSKEAAENIDWLLDGIYDAWIGMIAEGRGLSPEKVKALVDRAPLPAADALKAGLVDHVGSFVDFKQMVRKEFGKDVEIVKKIGEEEGMKVDFNNPFALFQMIGEMLQPKTEPRKPGIALIYIDGGIAMGKTEQSPFGGSSNVGSTTIRAAFEKARLDDAVKAVVVRVNSPGGSALASDIIWKAARRCAKEKPLIASMGNVAGSGGYYVSIPADVIFADDATITASIGVVGGKFVWRELMEDKLGITTATFDRGKHAGLNSMNRPWNDEEREFIRKYMNQVYEQFKGRVRESRGDRLKGKLEDMAGGRVYTGKQALKLGLIDKLGTLEDAIDFAAKKAELGKEYEVYVLPKAKNPFEEIIASMTGQEQEDEWEMSSRQFVTSDPLLRAAAPLLQRLAPDRAAQLFDALQDLVMLSRERVGCFMPFDLTIR